MGFGVTHWLDLSVESWSFEVSGPQVFIWMCLLLLGLLWLTTSTP